MNKDLVNQRFGKLLVIEPTHIIRNECLVWKCLCDCGEICFVKSSYLLDGRTKSCGCIRKVNGKLWSEKLKLNSGEAAFRAVLRRYKAQAKVRNLSFELTTEQFKTLTQQNCYYCGKEPKQEYKYIKIHNTGTYIYNGIDRIDSSCGYTLENCVSCCKKCNWAKKDSSKSDFIKWIKAVHSNIIEKERE